MGAFEARLKASARLRWMVPLVAVLVVVVVGGAWRLLSGRVDPAAARRHAEAMALVALDDLESLEKANKILEETGGRETGIAALDADRALSQLLLSTGLLEDVSGLAARLAAKTSERERLGAAEPPASPEALSALSVEIEALRGQVEPKRNAARVLSEKAYGTLTKMSGDREGDLPVARALAIHFASVGDREQALRFARSAGAAAEKDPWIQLALGWIDAREESKESRERAAAKLAALVTARPEAVRARFLLARVQAGLGKREAAAATLDGLLAVNPRHRRASRLKAELVAAVPPAAPPAPAPVSAPPPLPRPLYRPPVGAPPVAAPAGANLQPRPLAPVPPAPGAAPIGVPKPPPVAPAPATGAALPAPAAPPKAVAPAAAAPAPTPVAPAPPKVDAPVPRPPAPAPVKPPKPEEPEEPVGG